MILSVYLMRRLALSFLMVLGVFLGILILLDMVEQLRSFAGIEAAPAFVQLIGLTLLNAPVTLYQILPLIVVLATLSLFLALSRSSELVVIRAAGRSGVRLLLAPFLATLIGGALIVAVINPLVAASSREYARYANELRSGSVSVVSVSADGLWLRQGDAATQTVIHARSASGGGTVLSDVTFLVFSSGAASDIRIRGARAQLTPGAWEVTDATVWQLNAENPQRDARQMDVLRLPTDLTPEQIRDNFASPGAIAIWELPGFITALQRAGFSALEHRIWFQMELALPLMLAGMMLLATATSMYHARAGGAGLRALITILGGFGLFFLRNFAQVLGENGQIPVILAAWTLPVASCLLALGLLLHLEDG